MRPNLLLNSETEKGLVMIPFTPMDSSRRNLALPT